MVDRPKGARRDRAAGPSSTLPSWAAVVVLILVVANSGCRSNRSTAPASQAATLHLAQSAEPTTFDPAVVEDGPTIEVLMHVFDGLVQWTPQNALAPALAERWEVSPDGRTFTFHLRPDVKF